MKTFARAFTLLEVLVALAILAISATAIIGQTSNSLAQLSILEARTVASLLAETEIDKVIASEAFPPVGRSSNQVTFNDQQWDIGIEVSATSEPWLRRITVSVANAGNPDYELASLTTYRGRY